jgi:BASS family bile acid:Na+ symporter
MNPDDAQLNFNAESLFFLNLCLGFIMFGVALNLKWRDFTALGRQPKAVFLGLLAQLFLLPAFTFVLVYIIQPYPSLALGMILVAACPGGNISNFISHLAKANVALSVSLTGIVTLLCVITTPFNFSFWSSLLPISDTLRTQIHLDFWDMAQTILWLIILPILLGASCSHYLPKVAKAIQKPIQVLSLVIFVAFVLIAFYNNFEIFTNYFQYIFALVLLHNALAVFLGLAVAKLGKLPKAEMKTLAIETGIQNSGLGLILIFNFFNGLGGMALIAAWWGVWHIVSGLSLAWFWTRDEQDISEASVNQ